jgi:hypothetical protein
VLRNLACIALLVVLAASVVNIDRGAAHSAVPTMTDSSQGMGSPERDINADLYGAISTAQQPQIRPAACLAEASAFLTRPADLLNVEGNCRTHASMSVQAHRSLVPLRI